MDFIKTMKKREFIEMGLKTLAAILAAFLAIILMEGMIYAIELNALKTKGTTSSANSGSTIAYCIQESINKDAYYIVYYTAENDPKYQWSSIGTDIKTKEECLKMVTDQKVKEVVFHAPNAFDFSITSTHYIVMTVFVLAVAGFFVYKFFNIAKGYKQTEEQFLKTGTIEITNV